MNGTERLPSGIAIQNARPHDAPAILSLYPRAFPGEDLRPLVTTLIAGDVPVLSLVAMRADAVVGHALFTRFEDGRAALLGPLGVAPEEQRTGIGTALIAKGLRRLSETGTGHVFVLGDPNYYVRCGFTPETRVRPPYDLPEEWLGAWQSLTLGDAEPLASARCRLPAPWMEPRYWAP
ncbi:MAG: N-acetyltransferase [Pseudomonadota bacterium]